MEKDLKDYDGRVYNECLRTQVKDIFAARLWPSNNYMIDRDLEVVKMEIVIELLECFAHLKLKCVFAPKTVTIEGREIKVKYFTINEHIELQVCTLEECQIMEDTHKDYEERRSLNVESAASVKLTDSVKANTHTMDVDLITSFNGYSLTFEDEIMIHCNHFIRGSRDWMHAVSFMMNISSSTISTSYVHCR